MIISPEQTAAMLKDQAEREQRAEIYSDDLREVLSTPAGIRVLRHWLDCTCMFGSLSAATELQTIRNAALADYGHERMREITTASPEAFTSILLAGLREEAQQKTNHLNKEEWDEYNNG